MFFFFFQKNMSNKYQEVNKQDVIKTKEFSGFGKNREIAIDIVIRDDEDTCYLFYEKLIKDLKPSPKINISFDMRFLDAEKSLFSIHKQQYDLVFHVIIIPMREDEQTHAVLAILAPNLKKLIFFDPNGNSKGLYRIGPRSNQIKTLEELKKRWIQKTKKQYDIIIPENLNGVQSTYAPTTKSTKYINDGGYCFFYTTFFIQFYVNLYHKSGESAKVVIDDIIKRIIKPTKPQRSSYPKSPFPSKTRIGPESAKLLNRLFK